jgi:predicted transcriptional regulator of viral defense system
MLYLSSGSEKRMDSNLRTLGPAESKVVLSFREQGRSVVRVSDVLAILGSEPSARTVIRNLVRKGWLSRIVGGRYIPPFPGSNPGAPAKVYFIKSVS